MNKVMSHVSGMPNYTNMFQFEKDFNRVEARKWFETNWTTSFYFVVAYLSFLYFGSQWMKSRNRYQLQTPLILWNLGLATFSIFGSYRTFPELVWVLNQPKDGFYHSVCIPSWGDNQAYQFWTFLFITSKAVELGDTVFIVLRKQPLIFLHYYHHVTVLVYAWWTYGEFTAPTRWFTTINFMIHSLMYTYYGLKALKLRIPKPIAVAITSLQIVQMVVGMTVNLYAFRAKASGQYCHVSSQNILWSLTMYASYFVLFGRFFYKAYLTKPVTGKGGKVSRD